jgi:hypothetical protein
MIKQMQKTHLMILQFDGKAQYNVQNDKNNRFRHAVWANIAWQALP